MRDNIVLFLLCLQLNHFIMVKKGLSSISSKVSQMLLSDFIQNELFLKFEKQNQTDESRILFLPTHKTQVLDRLEECKSLIQKYIYSIYKICKWSSVTQQQTHSMEQLQNCNSTDFPECFNICIRVFNLCKTDLFFNFCFLDDLSWYLYLPA